MMETMESCVPPGFRFHPTDEELVGYYLRKKIASQKIDLDVIRDIDLYRIEPWDLQERCRIGYEDQNEWYFFSHKDKKYPTGTRTNRATMAGFWKATGRDKAVYDKAKLIGMRKTLVFYKGRAPNGQKTDWIMHEYRLESDENGHPQEEGWVVCRAFKKRTNSQLDNKGIEGFDPSYLYDEPSGMSSVIDPACSIDYMPPMHGTHNFSPATLLACKREMDSLSFISSLNAVEHFLQLPQLESPSLSLMKRPISAAYEEDQSHARHSSSSKRTSVTDWRALDRFVASQLSQEDIYGNSCGGEVGGQNNTMDNAFTAARDERNIDSTGLMNEFLSSEDDRDIGMICIFEK
ncbi:hypothetical protein SAY87_025031 [Trapa incisa]|uniref:NAC domain-containing protein n=1 Tax=Trapa incisa TaxID=236973 RepID=A0AAN7JGD9_9MYRT|nr:hypothetical protein SAY87_025031 [Trapa incisa]